MPDTTKTVVDSLREVIPDSLSALPDSAQSFAQGLAEGITDVNALWANLVAIAPKALRILLVVFLAWLLWRLLQGIIQRTSKSAERRGGPRSAQRVQTVTKVLRSALAVALFGLVGSLILAELGVNLGPLLAAAGVVGLAIGFGAQSLVKDTLNGFFFLLEGQVRVGDVVSAAGKAGLVENITVRTLTLRDFGGDVHVIPHGEITTVTNMTKTYSRALIEVGVAYREDPDHVMSVLMDEAKKLAESEEWGQEIIEEPEVYGIDAFGDSALVFKVRFATRPLSQWNVARAYRRRVKFRFDAENIEIPFPHRTVYMGEDHQQQAPPLRIVHEARELRRGDSGSASSTGTSDSEQISSEDAPVPDSSS